MKNVMKEQKHQFEIKESLFLENSYGTIKKEENVTLDVTIGIKSPDYGWFEIFDTKTGGENWYAEGGLWFTDGELVDYDGVSGLPVCILNKLNELGYNVEDME